MKIGIYNEPSRGGIGGAEICVALLAESLAKAHEVEIVHHKTSFTAENLARYCGVDLSGVSFRYVEPGDYDFGTTWNPWRRYKSARSWQAHLSKPYDLFVSFTHGFPPFCNAPRGVLTVLFPCNEAPHKEFRTTSAFVSPLTFLKHEYHKWEWRKRLDTYQRKLANSEFTRDWTRHRWDVECEVAYPPVDTDFAVEEKANAIISVGRFARDGHSKKQLELLEAFNGVKPEMNDWDYYCVGGIDDSPSGRQYFDEAVKLGEASGASVRANIDRAALRHLYQKSKVFWHAAGLNEIDNPELFEHFGVATVEAMAAGCVPVVINKGGQQEIVQHGVNGFLWNTLEELREYTTLLAQDEELRTRLATAARSRAQRFSVSNFLAQYSTILGLDEDYQPR
ncbi:MAG TPA: glycosyltransferase family 4 protein [Pyrinomonadaceae bacterium]